MPPTLQHQTGLSFCVFVYVRRGLRERQLEKATIFLQIIWPYEPLFSEHKNTLAKADFWSSFELQWAPAWFHLRKVKSLYCVASFVLTHFSWRSSRDSKMITSWEYTVSIFSWDCSKLNLILNAEVWKIIECGLLSLFSVFQCLSFIWIWL